jgi:hypothetical protein
MSHFQRFFSPPQCFVQVVQSLNFSWLTLFVTSTARLLEQVLRPWAAYHIHVRDVEETDQVTSVKSQCVIHLILRRHIYSDLLYASRLRGRIVSDPLSYI